MVARLSVSGEYDTEYDTDDLYDNEHGTDTGDITDRANPQEVAYLLQHIHYNRGCVRIPTFQPELEPGFCNIYHCYFEQSHSFHGEGLAVVSCSSEDQDKIEHLYQIKFSDTGYFQIQHTTSYQLRTDPSFQGKVLVAHIPFRNLNVFTYLASRIDVLRVGNLIARNGTHAPAGWVTRFLQEIYRRGMIRKPKEICQISPYIYIPRWIRCNEYFWGLGITGLWVIGFTISFFELRLSLFQLTTITTWWIGLMITAGYFNEWPPFETYHEMGRCAFTCCSACVKARLASLERENE